MKSFKIAVVAASEMTVIAFLTNHLKSLCEIYDVTVIVNTSDPQFLERLNIPATLIQLEVQRKIHLRKDIRVFLELIRIHKCNKFDLIYSVTPKAGMLAMLTGFFVRVPIRVHIFTGQVWVTKVGLNRFILKSIDICMAKFATHLLADSASQMQFLVKNKIVDKNKIDVLANGSIGGVNLKKFSTNRKIRTKVRFELNIDDSDIVFLYLGRLQSDKGIVDLVDAFKLLINQSNNVKLLIVGPDEAKMHKEILQKIGPSSNYVRLVGFTSNPENFMNAADVLCLPSYREGFGSVVIEAAAVGIPAIGSDIYGIRDAIIDNETGLLFPPHNVEMLFEAMQIMVLNEQIRKRLGHSAKQRAVERFSQEFVTKSLVRYFEEKFNPEYAK